eukprot:365660-Chlamydomonas_euryale.AAC.5
MHAPKPKPLNPKTLSAANVLLAQPPIYQTIYPKPYLRRAPSCMRSSPHPTCGARPRACAPHPTLPVAHVQRMFPLNPIPKS